MTMADKRCTEDDVGGGVGGDVGGDVRVKTCVYAYVREDGGGPGGLRERNGCLDLSKIWRF